MTFLQKLIFIAAALGAYTATVVHVHQAFIDAKQVKQLEQQATATREAMRASAQIDTGFNETSARLRQLELSANQRIEALHANPSDNCSLGPDRLHVLQDAIAAGSAAR